MGRIESAAFKALHQKEDLAILDVREVEEFQAGHIEGAVNAPLSTLDKGYEIRPARRGSVYSSLPRAARGRGTACGGRGAMNG